MSSSQSEMPLHMSIDCELSTILSQPQQQHAQIAQRWHSPSHPLHLSHFGGTSRASRRPKMTIQRLLPCFPPCNSAEVMQFVLHFANFVQ